MSIGPISGGIPPPPRWMVFVDGENFTIRSQQLASENRVPLISGPYWAKDAFLWFPESDPRAMNMPMALGGRAVRAYYYTSAVAAEDVLADQRASGVTGAVGLEADPVPVMFVAVTVNV